MGSKKSCFNVCSNRVGGMNYELDISHGLKTENSLFSHLLGILVDALKLVAIAGGGLHAVKNIRYCLRWSGRLAFVGK